MGCGKKEVVNEVVEPVAEAKPIEPVAEAKPIEPVAEVNPVEEKQQEFSLKMHPHHRHRVVVET